jgi:hypothetical protein
VRLEPEVETGREPVLKLPPLSARAVVIVLPLSITATGSLAQKPEPVKSTEVKFCIVAFCGDMLPVFMLVVVLVAVPVVVVLVAIPVVVVPVELAIPIWLCRFCSADCREFICCCMLSACCCSATI